MASFEKASAIQQTGSHTYTSHFFEDWCVGSVPNGGYVTSCILRVASLHFTTTLRTLSQPDAFTVHLEFIRRTSVGPVQYTVRDIKTGRRTSTIHITLAQAGREEIIGYVSHTNLATESGASFETGWKLDPAPHEADLGLLRECVRDGSAREGKDANWALRVKTPFAEFRKITTQLHTFTPRKGQQLASLADEWVAFRSGERWTNDKLGVICDCFPQLLEQFDKDRSKTYWYPTVLLNMDVKKRLPEEGVQFLFARVRTKVIRNGRYDLEVVVLDEGGDVVVLSHHVVLVMSASRNLKKREKTEDGSKL